MAERFKAVVLKTTERKFRRFESYSLRSLSVNEYPKIISFKMFNWFWEIDISRL